MDTYLLSIIEAAEASAPTPRIQVITSGGDWIRGLPCSTDYFRELTWPHHVQDVENQLKKTRRRELKENPNLAETWAAESYAAVTERQREESSPVLSLMEATLSFGGRGDGLNLTAVRVPLSAITSWWIAGASYIKPQSSGGGLVGGVIFPIGN